MSDPATNATPSYRILRTLKNDGFALTQLVEMKGERWVRKEFRFRFWWGRLLDPLARWCMRHELANCRRLEGLEGVAWRAVPLDERSFGRAWVEGVDLKIWKRQQRRPIPDDFFDRLRSTLTGMHARGLIYNDLAKKDNVIVDEKSRPVLIDFQISLRSYQGASRWKAALGGWLFRRLERDDWRHYAKMKLRLRPDLITDEERAWSERRGAVALFHLYAIRYPFHRLKRVIYPRGSNETFRFARPRDRKHL